LQKAAPQNPQDEEWDLHWAPNGIEIEMMEAGKNKNKCEHRQRSKATLNLGNVLVSSEEQGIWQET
jgi:hypothetical protein